MDMLSVSVEAEAIVMHPPVVITRETFRNIYWGVSNPVRNKIIIVINAIINILWSPQFSWAFMS